MYVQMANHRPLEADTFLTILERSSQLDSTSLVLQLTLLTMNLESSFLVHQNKIRFNNIYFGLIVVVGLGHQVLGVLLETGGCAAHHGLVVRPDPFYVDQVIKLGPPRT